jgi:hypothetical protein
VIYRLGEYELETETDAFWVAPTAVMVELCPQR